MISRKKDTHEESSWSVAVTPPNVGEEVNVEDVDILKWNRFFLYQIVEPQFELLRESVLGLLNEVALKIAKIKELEVNLAIKLEIFRRNI